MRCKEYKKYNLGQINKKEFQDHSKNCRICQELTKWETFLLSAFQTLKTPVQVPLLWSRIEKTLKEEEGLKQKDIKSKISRQTILRWSFASLLVLVIMLGAFLILNPFKQESGLLAQKALAKVEKKERAYVEAIEELETMVLPNISSLDLELMLLYRDKLETINEQIEQCKEAIERNPANAHIRHYFFAALQDKKQTLAEILDLIKET